MFRLRLSKKISNFLQSLLKTFCNNFLIREISGKKENTKNINTYRSSYQKLSNTIYGPMHRRAWLPFGLSKRQKLPNLPFLIVCKKWNSLGFWPFLNVEENITFLTKSKQNLHFFMKCYLIRKLFLQFFIQNLPSFFTFEV